jgi:hypothetical protein
MIAVVEWSMLKRYFSALIIKPTERFHLNVELEIARRLGDALSN